MAVESDLGTLIRMLNPHTDGAEGTMQFAPLVTSQPPTAPSVDPADLAQIRLEIDDGPGAWSFKTSSQRVQRAVKIEYRYPLRDRYGNKNGLFATDYLFIGYANGGSQTWP